MFCRFGRLRDRFDIFTSYKNNNFFIKNAVFCIFVSSVFKTLKEWINQ